RLNSGGERQEDRDRIQLARGEGVMKSGPAIKIEVLNPGLTVEKGPEHFEVALFRGDHQRSKAGFIRAFHGGPGVDQFPDHLPLLVEGSGYDRVRSPKNAGI